MVFSQALAIDKSSICHKTQNRYSSIPPPSSFSKTRHFKITFFLWAFCLLIFLPLPALAGALFPRYPVIENNVLFWEKIYGHYSISQAVIHDSSDLLRIYAVIPILDHRVPDSPKLNGPILKEAKNKYTRILQQLAKGVTPRSEDEKRIAAIFPNSTLKEIQQAANSIRIQIGQKERFFEGVIRSGAYLTEIRKIFQDHGLPEELAYLPHVESSFNLKAHSKFGASGIWQFTRATGRQFLTINYAIDERQDPILASRAAAKFLQKNHQRLGSWPLAITAYNYGPAGMLRAKKAHGNYERIFSNYNQGYFKFASRNFYPEFLAALNVAKRLEKDLSTIQDRPRPVLTITLPGYIAVNDLCRYFKISPNTIKSLNPALRPPVLEGKKYIPKGYTLRLPQNQQHKNLLSSIPQNFYHKKQTPTKFYQVRSGDTAGKIAIQHGVSLKALMQENRLDKKATVFLGQNIRIPRNQEAQRKGRQSIAPSQQQRTASRKGSVPVFNDGKKKEAAWKSIQRARGVVLGALSVQRATTLEKIGQGTITVQPEESIEILANWLNVKSEAIRQLNSLPPGRLLRPDEKILIPLTRVSTNEFEEKRFDFHLETEEDFYNAYTIVGVTTYKVSKGDTIWEICRSKFDLPFWLLKKYNTNLNFNRLRSSQQLTIPIVKAI